jgi:hypothetical protein
MTLKKWFEVQTENAERAVKETLAMIDAEAR